MSMHQSVSVADSTLTKYFKRYHQKDCPEKYQRIYINPDKIKKTTCIVDNLGSCSILNVNLIKDYYLRPNKTPFVVNAGYWDKLVVDLCENRVIARCLKKLQSNIDWESVGELDFLMQQISVKGRIDGCRNYEDLVQRYKVIDEIIEYVKCSKRLKSSYEIRGDNREVDGIGIFISRNGEIIKGNGGLHRFAIAKYFKVRWIPVGVQCIHPEAIEQGHWESILASQPEFYAQDDYQPTL